MSSPILLWEKKAVLSPPNPRPFQRGGLSMNPLFCGGNLSSALLSPAVPTCCGLPFFEPQPPLPEGPEAAS